MSESSDKGPHLNNVGLDIEVHYSKNMLQSFSANTVMDALKNDKQLMQLFSHDTYEYTSLIQDDIFSDDLIKFEDMLSIVWLRALRTGIWRVFLHALHAASHDVQFEVNVGVSGIVTLPVLQACNQTRLFTIELNSKDIINVPAYIWAYVRPLGPNADLTGGIVIIGHNTPFLTVEERDSLCENVCHEVSWLKKSVFHMLLGYHTYDMVQCCRVADVKDKLDNFPSVLPEEHEEPDQSKEPESIK